MSRKSGGKARRGDATNLLQELSYSDTSSKAAKIQRDTTPEAKLYGKSLNAMTDLIKRVACCGNIDVMLDCEKLLQERDLQNYATNKKEKEHVLDGLNQLESGILKYRQLLEAPDFYREDAKTYYRNERDSRLDVPKDGMRKAMNSQSRRLQNRMALVLTEEEKVVLGARIVLLRAIDQIYSSLQKNVVHE